VAELEKQCAARIGALSHAEKARDEEIEKLLQQLVSVQTDLLAKDKEVQRLHRDGMFWANISQQVAEHMGYNIPQQSMDMFHQQQTEIIQEDDESHMQSYNKEQPMGRMIVR